MRAAGPPRAPNGYDLVVLRLAHISDLHFGALEPVLVTALLDDLRAFAPHVIVITGDLTQRARRRQLVEARQFLDGLPAPHVVLCGNHDLAPWTSPLERALAPFARFRRHIGSETPPPVAVPDAAEGAEGADGADCGRGGDEGLVVIGLNSADPRRFAEGGISRDELARVLAEARRHKDHFCVVAAHHPLVETELRPLPRRVKHHEPLEETLDRAGVDLVLTGHLHESFSGPAAARTGARKHVLVVQASTATSYRLRGHVNAWNQLRVDGPQDRARVTVEVRVADGDRFRAGNARTWRRADSHWLEVP